MKNPAKSNPPPDILYGYFPVNIDFLNALHCIGNHLRRTKSVFSCLSARVRISLSICVFFCLPVQKIDKLSQA